MYTYEWDASTGGYLLTPMPLKFSKEPRPVYYKELDILGFDKFWNYAKNDSYPYMWAEANNYFYRGRLVAKTKGGSIYTAPEIVLIEDPEPDGMPLRFVDIPAMVENNRDIMEQLTQDTIKKIYNTFVEYKNKVDVFYVAFSGGKDSVVTLDLVQRALPHNEFKVMFGDTGMEFPDTYDVVDKIKAYCAEEQIDFLTAKSEFTPEYTWNRIGPPAQTNRWCCCIHKTAPQINLLRRVTNKPNFVGMAFVGVRSSESVTRSEYDDVSLGKKHGGQYSSNAILDWNSAELFLYIYQCSLCMNECYKKGNSRAGCLVCPNVSEKNFFFRQACYRKEVNEYLQIIRNLYKNTYSSKAKLDEFMENTGWKVRVNGRDIALDSSCIENVGSDRTTLTIKNPTTNWKEWIKPVGKLQNEGSPYAIIYRGKRYSFSVNDTEDGYIEVSIDGELCKKDPVFVKHLKNAFRKSSSCIGCKECEANCHKGFLKVSNGEVSISDNCVHCLECMQIDYGCLVYKSLVKPRRKSNMTKSLNCYSTHAPKIEWIKQYFEYKNSFSENNDLGSQMFSFFKRFLRDAKLLDEKGFTRFAEIINDIGLDEDMAWGLILVNLAYTPQIGWFITEMQFFESISKEYVISKLFDEGNNERASTDIWRSYCRFLNLPFAKIGLGIPEEVKGKVISFTKYPWQNPDDKVILYALYKFAEACGNYKQFTLTRLLNNSIESDGISPARIFGLDRETMEKILNGLSFNYPDLIESNFVLGLDSITLKSDKTPEEILDELF